MYGVLFTIDYWEFTKGVAEVVWACLIAFRIIWLPLLGLLIFKLLLEHLLRKRSNGDVDLKEKFKTVYFILGIIILILVIVFLVLNILGLCESRIIF